MPIQFQQITLDGSQTNRAVASWSRGEGGFTASFEARYRIGSGNFVDFSTTNTSLNINGIDPGQILEVQVRGVGISFPVKKSIYAIAKAEAPSIDADQISSIGVTSGAPQDIQDLSIQPLTNTTGVLRWKFPTGGVDLKNLNVDIRHSSKTDGSGTLTDSVKVTEVPAATNSATIAIVNGEYLLRFRDLTTKLYSNNAKSVVINIPDTLPKLLIENRREDTTSPPFQGNYQGCFYSDEYDGLVLDGDETIDEVLLIDDLGEIDFIGIRLATGEYEFANVLDLGGKFEVQLERTLVSRGLIPSDLLDDREELIDRWTDWDGTLAEDTSVAAYFRASDDAVSNFELLLEQSPDFFLLEDGDKLQQESTTAYGPWSVLEHGTFVGRTFQFKAELEADHVDQTPLVDQLGYKLHIPRRTESSSTIASGAGAKAVTFDNAFYQAPTIGITASNLASGDYYEITSVTRAGFTVHFKDSSNSSVDRNFQYVAAGFGTEQT